MKVIRAGAANKKWEKVIDCQHCSAQLLITKEDITYQPKQYPYITCPECMARVNLVKMPLKLLDILEQEYYERTAESTE